MVALKIYYNYMVQARKETHDHVSVRVKCLNYTCPNEFSVVGINKAIYKEHLNTGDCGRIGSHLLILYAHLLLISSMILRVGTTPKSSSIGGRFVCMVQSASLISARLVSGLLLNPCSKQSIDMRHLSPILWLG